MRTGPIFEIARNALGVALVVAILAMGSRLAAQPNLLICSLAFAALMLASNRLFYRAALTVGTLMVCFGVENWDKLYPSPQGSEAPSLSRWVGQDFSW